jgi:UDP-glucose 6-dehydrogenase
MIVGVGYYFIVSIATFLSQNNEVFASILMKKVERINNKISPIGNKEIGGFILDKEFYISRALIFGRPWSLKI